MSASEADERTEKIGRSNRAHQRPCAGLKPDHLREHSRVTGEKRLVPIVGIELTTYRLQGDCSTTELNRHA